MPNTNDDELPEYSQIDQNSRRDRRNRPGAVASGETSLPVYAQVAKKKRPDSTEETALPVYAQVDKNRARGGATGAAAGPVLPRNDSDTESIVYFEENDLYAPSPQSDEHKLDVSVIPSENEQYANVPSQSNGNAEGYYNLPTVTPNQGWYENCPTKPASQQDQPLPVMDADGSEGYYNLPNANVKPELPKKPKPQARKKPGKK